MKEIVFPLIEWFSACGKELPWRIAPTPYHIWISEIMLQQTRIEAVIPYYNRFLSELPTVKALAGVSDDRLLKLWEGLGYYSRARNLKKAAIVLENEYDGILPSDAGELKKLPGIGDYTAGAIASMAYGKPEPAVDGNVLRVMARLCADASDIMLPATKREVTERLRRIYPSGKEAGLFTQAIMELGETVCIPGGAPRCELCPLRAFCRAYGLGTVEDFPVRSPKKERRIENRTVFLLRCGNRYAVCRRPAEGLLAGMWEFPNTLSGEERPISEALSPETPAFSPCGEAKHIFTHVEWNMRGLSAKLTIPAPLFEWKTAEEIKKECAIPTAFRFFLSLLE